MKAAFLLASVILAPNLATAQENFAVSGAGTTSCGKFLEDQESLDMKNFYVSWLQGFLSGLNMADASAGKKMLLLPDSETINLYVANYCKTNPLERPVGGAMQLYRALRSRDQQKLGEP